MPWELNQGGDPVWVGPQREAERMLAEIVRDEPHWEDVFRIERIELGRESLN